MNSSLRAVAASSLIVFAAVAGSAGQSSAATRTACEVMPASQASGILGSAVTAQVRPVPISAGSSVCVYMTGGRPIVQLGLTVMASDAVAEQMFKIQQQTSSQHPNVASRRKGNIVLSAITIHFTDARKLGALLDAAAKNL
jgi:hypothetical protein